MERAASGAAMGVCACGQWLKEERSPRTHGSSCKSALVESASLLPKGKLKKAILRDEEVASALCKKVLGGKGKKAAAPKDTGAHALLFDDEPQVARQVEKAYKDGRAGASTPTTDPMFRPRRVLLVVAMDCEAEAILALPLGWTAATKLVGGFAFHEGGSGNLALVQAGVGQVMGALAAQAALLRWHDAEVVLSLGVGGALVEDLQPGDLFVASRVLKHDARCGADLMRPGELWLSNPDRAQLDPGHTVSEESLRWLRGLLVGVAHREGTLLSGDEFALTARRKAELRALDGAALVIDMEAAGIEQAVRGFGLPLLAMRTVADRLDPAAGVGDDYLRAKARAAKAAAAVVMRLASGDGSGNGLEGSADASVGAAAADVAEELQEEPPLAKCSASVRRARIAVVGCGGWAQGWHLPHLASRDDAEIAALVDTASAPASCYNTAMEPLEALGRRYGAPCFRSLDALLADAPLAASIDGVICATPHAAHEPVGLAALESGWHILMEKPLATALPAARALLEAARARPSLAFLVNNSANWRRGAREAREMVAAGRLGSVRHVSTLLAAPLSDLFHDPTNVTWVRPTGDMLGNGFGWGQLTHTFAWVYAVTGLTPRTVFAALISSESSGADVIDALTVTCACGATISATGVGTSAGSDKHVANWIFGTEGMLSFSGAASMRAADADPTADAHAPSRLQLTRHDGSHERGPAFEFEHLAKSGTGPGSLDALVAACRGEPYYVGAGALEGLKAMATIEAMYRSARSGKLELVADACE